MGAVLSLAELQALPGRLLHDLPVSESGAHRPGRNGVAVRSFPFPYRAGLAVSNDCDSQSLDCFFDWHQFVNGRETTRYGEGLGLEVGDSFWVYGGSVEPHLLKGNPFDAAHSDGYALAQLVELGRAGWFDTLHSFGNWSLRFVPPERKDDPSIHSREQIAKGLDLLDRLGLKPSVYVNHSGSPSNVGGPWGWYQKADDASHGLYSLDLLKEFGFRYFWLDSCTQLDKFGEDMDFGDEWHLRRALDRFRWFHWFRRVDAERRPHPVAMPGTIEEQRELLVGMFNRLMFPVDAQDGSRIMAFKRYRDIDQPVGATFPMQVTAAKLDALERGRGSVVVYQHFGVFGPRGRSPAASRPHRSRSPIPALDEHSVATWRLIADRQRSGRLFVATTSRLLNWVWLRDALRFQTELGPERWTIQLEGVQCPVVGAREREPFERIGLAFTVPQNAPEVVVIDEHNRTLPVRRERDPVHEGTDAVYLPWQALEWPGGPLPA